MSAFFRNCSKMMLSLLLLLLSADVLLSHEENDRKEAEITDDAFARKLLGNSGVNVPVYLGCRKLAGTEPQLPIYCLHQNILTKVSSSSGPDVDSESLFASLPESDWWVEVEKSGLKKFSSDIDWNWEWSYRGDYRSIYCVLGVPLIEIGRVLNKAECVIVNTSDINSQNGKAVRLTFEDSGELQLYADNERRDLVRLKNFISYFALATWN